MTITRLAAGALAMAALALLAGCDLRPRGVTTEVDEQRLAALQSEEFFGEGTAQVGGDPHTSANATVARGQVWVGNGPWGESGGDDGDPWLSSITMLNDVRDAGWSVTRVECTVDSSGVFAGATVVALKDLGGFTAALEAQTESGSSTVVGLVPYHGESENPWQPTAVLPAGESCLELPEPPTSDAVLGGTPNLERAFLPPEN